jgi:hypothetical protein
MNYFNEKFYQLTEDQRADFKAKELTKPKSKIANFPPHRLVVIYDYDFDFLVAEFFRYLGTSPHKFNFECEHCLQLWKDYHFYPARLKLLVVEEGELKQ